MRKTDKPDGLLLSEATKPLRINGLRAVDFIRRAYDLGDDCNGEGRFDLSDPVQTELRHIQGWIQMAQTDAMEALKPDSDANKPMFATPETERVWPCPLPTKPTQRRQ